MISSPDNVDDTEQQRALCGIDNMQTEWCTILLPQLRWTDHGKSPKSSMIPPGIMNTGFNEIYTALQTQHMPDIILYSRAKRQNMSERGEMSAVRREDSHMTVRCNIAAEIKECLR